MQTPHKVETFGASFRRLGRSIDLLEDEVRLAKLWGKFPAHALMCLEQLNARVEELQSLMGMLERNKDG